MADKESNSACSDSLGNVNNVSQDIKDETAGSLNIQVGNNNKENEDTVDQLNEQCDAIEEMETDMSDSLEKASSSETVGNEGEKINVGIDITDEIGNLNENGKADNDISSDLNNHLGDTSEKIDDTDSGIQEENKTEGTDQHFEGHQEDHNDKENVQNYMGDDQTQDSETTESVSSKDYEDLNKELDQNKDLNTHETQTEDREDMVDGVGTFLSQPTDDAMKENEEGGIVINENDIVKATEVFGKGKRGRLKKIDECFTEDFDVTPPRHIYNKKADLTDQQKELLHKPFKEGWKREVVFRSTFQVVTKLGAPKQSTPADVYYHPPVGRKLRSMVDIAKHLVMTDSTLTCDNFSFLRKPILEPPFEVVRYAGSIGRGSPKTPSPRRPKVRQKSVIVNKPEIVIERDGEVNVVPYEHDVQHDVHVDTPLNIKGRKPGRGRPPLHGRGRPPALGRGQPLPHKKRGRLAVSPEKKIEIIKQEEDGCPLQDVNTSPKEPSPKRSKPTARKSTTQKVFRAAKPVIENQNDTLEELCNMHCPGRNFIPPSLQCVVCLCLFHPECVNTDPDIQDFVCLRCVTTSSGVLNTKPSYTVKKSPPLQRASPVKTVLKTVLPSPTITESPGVVKIKEEPMDADECSNKHKDPKNISDTTIGNLKSILDKRTPSSSMPVLLNTFNGSQATLAFNGPQNNEFFGSTPLSSAIIVRPPATTLMVRPTFSPILSSLQVSSPLAIPSSTSFSTFTNMPAISMLSNLSKSPPISQPPKLTAAPVSKSSPVGNGIDLNQAAKNGQLLTLPGAVAKRLNLKQPLALKINNMQITVPPSCFLHTPDGLKVFLPPKTFPVQIGETAKLSVTVTNDKSLSPNANISVKIGDGGPLMNGTDKKDLTSDNKASRASRCWKGGINPGSCYIKRLYGGFDCMLCIFQYLNMQDLARVSLVCRTWRTLAQNPILWQEVKFRNVKVVDWKKAVQFLIKRAVQSLNLRGLLHYENRNHTWHQFLSVVSQMTCVRNVHFGLVPGSVLHHVCEKMPHLEVFTAEWISDHDDDQKWEQITKINVGKFSSLENLKELKIRGMAGLTLPSFSLSGGLSDLVTLKHITKLSMTTLKNIEETDFAFLEKMSQLQSLELGDCKNWTSKTYSLLPNLINLKSLRLENGGKQNSDDGLGLALSQMPRLMRLELIMFVLPDNIQGFEQLNTLVIWPNTQDNVPAPVNTSMMRVISRLSQLQRLEWGILTNKNSSIILDNDVTNSEWIPFLPTSSSVNGASVSQLGAEPTVEYVSVIQFTTNLSSILPNTKIKVYNPKVFTMED